MVIDDFHRAVRDIRIAEGILLYDMAKHLRLTSAELSGIECGRRPIPVWFVSKLLELYPSAWNYKERLDKGVKERRAWIMWTTTPDATARDILTRRHTRLFPESARRSENCNAWRRYWARYVTSMGTGWKVRSHWRKRKRGTLFESEEFWLERQSEKKENWAALVSSWLGLKSGYGRRHFWGFSAKKNSFPKVQKTACF